HGTGLFHRLREQRYGVGDASLQSVRRTQGWSHQGEKEWEIRVLTDAHGPFELEECPAQVALAEGQQTNTPRGKHEAREVTYLLGNPEPFVPESPALNERAQLGMACDEPSMGLHGR